MGGDEGLETNMVSVKTYIVVVAYGRVPNANAGRQGSAFRSQRNIGRLLVFWSLETRNVVKLEQQKKVSMYVMMLFL